MLDSIGDSPALTELHQQLAVLNEIARVATLDVALRDALQQITDILRARFEWELVACLTIDREELVAVCEALSTALPADSRTMPGARGDKLCRIGDTLPLGQSMLGKAIDTGTLVLLDGAEAGDLSIGLVPGVRAELTIPIKHGGDVIALLHLGSKRWAAFRDQLPLLTAVANQVASVIASANRLEELHRRATLTETMSQVSRLAMEATDLPEILERVVFYMAEKFPVDIASILLLDDTGSKFIFEAYSGSLALRMPDGEEWPTAIGVCGRSVRMGQPQLVIDPALDPDYVPGNDSVQSEYIVPIRYRDRILGVLNLESVERDTFTPYVQTVFRSLADQIAGAVNLSSVNQRLVETNRIVAERTRDLMEANRKLQAANAELERLSSLDGLTAVANRRRFEEVLDVEWRRAYRTDRPISAMLADVDYFKGINDTFGHQHGDDCLRQIAQTLVSGLRRASDLVARYGGEEFAMILPETSAEHALSHADRLRCQIESLRIPHPASDVSQYVTVSIGVATMWPRHVEQPDLLIQAADLALYEAKRNGRNRVEGRAIID